MSTVVLGDGAAPIEWTSEGGFTLHAAPIGLKLVHYIFHKGLLFGWFSYSTAGAERRPEA